MKFLCVRCDEAMKISSASNPDEGGSITAMFGCPNCGNQIAMLTNPYETQLVQSLGVKIGPAGEEAAESRCPFSGMLGNMPQPVAPKPEISWTTEAEARLANIPEFIRPMARQGIEHYAKSQGHAVIDDAVMEKARGQFGM